MGTGVVSILLLASVSLATVAGDPPAGESSTVGPGSRIERELALDGVHRYTVDVPAGHGLRAVVEQRGIDDVVRIVGPDGVQLAELDAPTGAEGPETIDIEAEVTGTHTIEIRPFEENTGPGRYELRIDRIVSPADLVVERKAEAARKEAAIAWMRDRAVPLRTVVAGSGFEDLAALKEKIGGARVVALGEATHGTREFFQMKHRLLEFLVSEMGFTAFGIEATLPEAFEVDRWVVNGEGDPAKALAGLYFWTWNTEEVMDLLEWMRAWNADPGHARKVRFYGIDMQAPVRAAKIALEALADLDRGTADRLRSRLAPTLTTFDAWGVGAMPKPELENLLAAARELEEALAARRASLDARQGRESTARVLRCARVLVQNLEMNSRPAEGSIRDVAMAENSLWALEQEGPDGKLVVWAHNGHVADSAGSLGGELRRTLGHDLRILGFSFFEGAFQAMAWPPPKSGLTTFVAPPAAEGSLDASLAAAGLELALLDLRSLPADGAVSEWLAGRRAMRSSGAIYDPAMDAFMYDDRPVRDLYDALVFFRRTSAARAMAVRRPAPPLPVPSNLDFEDGEGGSVPRHWRSRPDNEMFGYRVSSQDGGAAGDGRILCAEGLPVRRYGEMWGGATQVLAAESFRGKRLRVSGSVRADAGFEAHLAVAPTTAAITLSVPRGSAKARGHGAWERIVAEVDVPQDATSVSLLVGGEGVGTACFDDLALEVMTTTAEQAGGKHR